MIIGIPKELFTDEKRVSATPNTVTQIMKLGFEVVVESGAGDLASFSDQAFVDAGAKIVSADEALAQDIVFKVNAPNDDEIAKLKEGATLVSFIWPAQNAELLEKLKARKINTLAMDAVPRISRAQSLDALSSMANIAGYRAIVEAASEFGRFFTGQITAAGKVPPAKVLVIGAGVAGLAAIGAAGSLGAVVRAFDVRPEVKEQIESMGATFLAVDFNETSGKGDGYATEMSDDFNRKAEELYAKQTKEVDIIVTTALIPGRPAPRLITKEMVASMQPGSVIVDLAAANGGNCELTKANEVVVTDNQVKIIGYTDLPSRLPAQSSQLYGTNLVNLLKLLCKNKDGQINIDFEDVVIRGVTAVKDGEITYPAPPIKVSAAKPQAKAKAVVVEEKQQSSFDKVKKPILMLIALALFLWLCAVSPVEFLSHFTVFVLSCVVGYYVVWNVSHALHTPLMAVTNAISGIIIVGALLQIGHSGFWVSLLSFIAILVASINIFGGFKVTQRMLAMFRKN